MEFAMMSDAEFREFLDALARKHLRPPRLVLHPMEFHELRHQLEHMIRLHQLTGVTLDDLNNDKLLLALAEKLQHAYLHGFVHAMEQSGVIQAIEEDPETLFSNIRISVVPKEDIELLRQAGHPDPDAELILLSNYARTHLAHRQRELSPTDLVRQAPDLVNDAGKRLERVVSAESPNRQRGETKKRKILNGVGKILSGGILGTGNVLLGLGGIVAPNPAIAYGVIGSCAVAVASVCQGAGDLRGE
jgi:hypothetical protein